MSSRQHHHHHNPTTSSSSSSSSSSSGSSSKKKSSTNGTLSKSSYAKVSRLVSTIVHLMYTNKIDTNLLTIAMHTNPKPTASFYDFTFNMLSGAKLSLPVILVSLKYLHLYLVQNTRSIKDQNMLIVVAAMTANKFLDDLRLSNSWWSRSSGFSLQQVNDAELIFLEDISYCLHLRDREYITWVEEMQKFGKWLEETGTVQQHLRAFPSPSESQSSSPLLNSMSPKQQNYMATPTSNYTSPTSSYRNSTASSSSGSPMHFSQMHSSPARTPIGPSQTTSKPEGSIDNFLQTQNLLLQLAESSSTEIKSRTIELLMEMQKQSNQQNNNSRDHRGSSRTHDGMDTS